MNLREAYENNLQQHDHIRDPAQEEMLALLEDLQRRLHDRERRPRGWLQGLRHSRFIALVDEFYDRRVKLIIAAVSDIDHLYTGKRLSFEFERTVSRLIEMQSTAYLALPHLA